MRQPIHQEALPPIVTIRNIQQQYIMAYIYKRVLPSPGVRRFIDCLRINNHHYSSLNIYRIKPERLVVEKRQALVQAQQRTVSALPSTVQAFSFLSKAVTECLRAT